MGFVLLLTELLCTRRWLSEDLKKETRRVIDDSVALSLVDDRDYVGLLCIMLVF